MDRENSKTKGLRELAVLFAIMYVAGLAATKDPVSALLLPVVGFTLVSLLVGAVSSKIWVKASCIAALIIVAVWTIGSADREERAWYDLPAYSRP